MTLEQAILSLNLPLSFAKKIRNESYFRISDEKTPSFAINPQGEWYDFTKGKGGNIEINGFGALCKHFGVSAREVSVNLEQDFVPKHLERTYKAENLNPKQKSSQSLLNYALERGISNQVTIRYCKIVFQAYSSQARAAGKKGAVYNLGFESSKGYELRNVTFKGCVGGKGISILKCGTQSPTLLLFEGFFDFLSYVEKEYQATGSFELSSDAVVLNSVFGVNQLIQDETLQKYSHYVSYLDNDFSGRAANFRLKNHYKTRFNFMGTLFDSNGVKDFNEYWLKVLGKKNAVSQKTEKIINDKNALFRLMVVCNEKDEQNRDVIFNYYSNDTASERDVFREKNIGDKRNSKSFQYLDSFAQRLAKDKFFIKNVPVREKFTPKKIIMYDNFANKCVQVYL